MALALTMDGNWLLQEGIVENFVTEPFVHSGGTPAVWTVLQARA
jgi:hypothetical protein